jgi:protein-disulfide isomerase
MFAISFRVAIAGAILVFIPLLNAAATDAPRTENAERLRIDQAVQTYLSKQQQDQEKTRDQLIANRTTALLGDPASPVLGNAKGDVAVIEFFDYACPYCKAIEPRLEKFLKDDKGAKLIVKEFPILTPESLIATKAALAAVKQGKYEAFHNTLMNFKGRLTTDVIFDTAKDVGLDVNRLRKDMDAPEIADEIIANFNLARALRIFETPGFIAGGHMLSATSADIDFPKVAAAARAK